MGKRLLLIIVAVFGIGVFAATFVVSRYLISPAKTQAAPQPPADGSATAKEAPKEAAVPELSGVEEKHLYELIKEVREKVRECQKREQELAEQEKRMQMTCQVIDREAQNLENQRLQLAAALTKLKEAQAEIEKTRVAIVRDEAVNLKKVSAVYDKMDAAAGSRILEGMCTNKQESDAVKILFYMQERSVAKVLAEMTDKGLAARLCEQLKRVKEQS
jgi:flagellar motility protein MotE (MotC chaperone)